MPRRCKVFDHCPIGLAVMDPAGHFVLTNKAYRDIGGYTEKDLKSRNAAAMAHPEDLIENGQLVKGMRSGDIDNSVGERRYICKDGDIVWVRQCISSVRNGDGEMVNAIALVQGITERKRAGADHGRSNVRIQQVCAAEQKRIGRELHDNTGQLLASLKMNLYIVKKEAANLSAQAQRALTASAAIAERCVREIRTSAYLLCPPELERGLSYGLAEYVAGYIERTGIAVALELPSDLDRVPLRVQSALFQIVREALTNIYRHAHSATAAIRLERHAANIALDVFDTGKGTRAKTRKHAGAPCFIEGIGINSMRERAAQLGGALYIHSNACGTRLQVVLPLSRIRHG